MNILGINAFHGDASACLVSGGVLRAAVEEERFRRVKHWAGFPTEAIKYCLASSKMTLADVDVVALNSNPRANRWRKLYYVLRNRPDPKFLAKRLASRKKRMRVPELLEQAFPNNGFRGKVEHVEHHLAHLASAFYVSPFEEAAVASIDGFGDFASAAWGIGRGNHIEIVGRVHFPHSLGIFYETMTHYLGFRKYGDEYKVMGLAPYGKPEYMDAMREIVYVAPHSAFRLNLKYFRHHTGEATYSWENGEPTSDDYYSDELEKLLGPARKKDDPLTQQHKDIARSVQTMYEDAAFELLNGLHERFPVKDLCLAGGCAMNSVANGKVYLRTPYRRLYVQAAAGDAGGAIGAAYGAYMQVGGDRKFVMRDAYWGPEFNDVEIATLLNNRRGELDQERCEIAHLDNEQELCRQTAQIIADGNVVGWFQGRLEWGPRALGNRSIVCDPRRADMKDILNSKIKRRESFRPFAPSILREHVAKWFELEDDVPFMMQVFQIREDKRGSIPAVTHVDGSGRLQTVTRDGNARYYGLIDAFHALTGVPIVLNTSFNENEPIVNQPSEALNCFLRTRMDALVLGNYIVRRTK